MNIVKKDGKSREVFDRDKLFNGMMTAIVQSHDIPGEITLTAKAKGLKSAKIVIKTE